VDQPTGATRREVLKTAGTALAGLGLAGAASAAPNTVEVNVGYSAPRGKRAAKADASSIVREFNFDALTLTVAENAIDGLRQRPDVRYVERNGTMHALGQQLTWGVDRVDAEVATANGSTGAGADVAIIDTGIDSDHPDLVDNLGTGKAFVKARGPTRRTGTTTTTTARTARASRTPSTTARASAASPPKRRCTQ
jgi:subtilisin